MLLRSVTTLRTRRSSMCLGPSLRSIAEPSGCRRICSGVRSYTPPLRVRRDRFMKPKDVALGEWPRVSQSPAPQSFASLPRVCAIATNLAPYRLVPVSGVMLTTHRLGDDLFGGPRSSDRGSRGCAAPGHARCRRSRSECFSEVDIRMLAPDGHPPERERPDFQALLEKHGG